MRTLTVSDNTKKSSFASFEVVNISSGSDWKVDHSHGSCQKFELSPKRWIILASMFTMGFMSGLVNEPGAILNIVVEILDMDFKKFVNYSQMFLFLVPIAALPTAAFVDKFGLKTSAYAYLFLVMLRNCSRTLLFSPTTEYWSSLRYFYWIFEGLLKIMATLVFICLPLKVSESWFAKEERSFAWAVIMASRPLGSCISNLLVPSIVTDIHTTEFLAYMNMLALLITALVVVAGITRSVPKSPPSSRREKSTRVDGQSWQQNWHQLLQNHSLLIHMFVISSFSVVYITLNNIMQDILAAFDLSPVFAGKFLASVQVASSGVQLAGSLALGRSAKTKLNDQVTTARECKVCIVIQCIAFLFMVASFYLQNLTSFQHYLTLATTLVYASISSWNAATFTDVSVQLIAGLTSEATISAFRGIMSCILANIFSFTFVSLRSVDPESRRVDYSMAMLFAGSIISSVTLIYLIFFQLPAEKTKGPQSKDIRG